MISKDVLEYCAKAIIQHLGGNIEQFERYKNKAMQIYEEEVNIATIGELIPASTKKRIRKMVS